MQTTVIQGENYRKNQGFMFLRINNNLELSVFLLKEISLWISNAIFRLIFIFKIIRGMDIK